MAIQLPDLRQTADGWTVDDASPSLLVELLDELARCAADAGAPLDDVLQPGLSRQQVLDGLGELGLPAPDELVAWWGWHNGSRPDLIGGQGLALNSLEYAIATYPRDSLGTGEFSWNPAYVTVLGPGSYGVSVSTAANASPPAVRATESGQGTEPDRVDNQAISLCTVVTWWITARRNGWITWQNFGDYGSWVADIDHYPAEWRVTGLAHF
ncbi:hypothetical protein KNO15_21980 [Leifsonia shinshuensis]|uniref:hypothetical protein n=1 Tax=Leifsonia shinshuensis TaxID=150026 RepID=UPI001F51346E|nr:hypothetical protein [Leifsonia shinshuensis]MCI0159380.1 hypothetical protein [Leifsonia shinshuensis]